LRWDFEAFAAVHGLSSYIPAPEFCTDNAAMVAALALEKIKSGDKGAWDLSLDVYARR